MKYEAVKDDAPVDAGLKAQLRFSPGDKSRIPLIIKVLGGGEAGDGTMEDQSPYQQIKPHMGSQPFGVEARTPAWDILWEA